MYGMFAESKPETTYEKETWKWLRKGDLKAEMEAALCAGHGQTIRTNMLNTR